MTVFTTQDNMATTGTGQAGGVAITAEISRFTSVQTNGSAVLPPNAAGTRMVIINYGSNGLVVFPSSGEYLDGFLNGSFGRGIGVKQSAEFYCPSNGNWFSK